MFIPKKKKFGVGVTVQLLSFVIPRLAAIAT
jgi:hypothetical protein